jgi:hypothetical protein
MSPRGFTVQILSAIVAKKAFHLLVLIFFVKCHHVGLPCRVPIGPQYDCCEKGVSLTVVLLIFFVRFLLPVAATGMDCVRRELLWIGKGFWKQSRSIIRLGSRCNVR